MYCSDFYTPGTRKVLTLSILWPPLPSILPWRPMSDPTQLHLPQSFPYPITITDLAVNPSNNVERGSRLLSYSFVHVVPDPNTPPEVRYGTWDSTIEGTLDKWNFRSGDVVSARKARDVPAVLITEPCKHGVQLGGLCCLCGKDMTRCVITQFSTRMGVAADLLRECEVMIILDSRMHPERPFR